MRILIGKTFGLGNACLTVPLVKALHSMGHSVDVLIGTGLDDLGADAVFLELKSNLIPSMNVYRDVVLADVDPYDVAIMAIPYDGRWRNGLDFKAKLVMDVRSRPGNVPRLGFDMWEKHEVEYMMENARLLGFSGETPDPSFLNPRNAVVNDVYLGLGFKRDAGGFGASKHFGNERFAALMQHITELRPGTQFISSGPIPDLIEARKIKAFTGNSVSYQHITTMNGLVGFQQTFGIISVCSSFVGNDTGTMHCAASVGMPTMGLFAYEGLLRKNPPFCARSSAILFAPDCPPIEDIAKRFVDFVWGQ